MKEIMGGGSGDKVTDFDSLSSVEFAGNSISVETYLRDAERNLLAMSRTAQGVVDTSASAKKALQISSLLIPEKLRPIWQSKTSNPLFEKPTTIKKGISSLQMT